MGTDETKTSDDQNPSVTFTDVGTYSVRFYASNAAGADWENNIGYNITVASAPVLRITDFSNISTTRFSLFIVQFTDSSSASTEKNWSIGYGDTTNSTPQHPVHTYASDNTHGVALTTIK